MKKIILLIVFLSINFCVVHAQTRTEKSEREIVVLMQQLADAALKSETAVAEKIYADNLMLTSQSGKVYTKKDSLLDLKNAFELYRNDDLKFLHTDKKTILVNYQNTRKRKTLDEAKYRVTSVWVKRKDGWKIVSLQSSKIVIQGM